MLRRNRTGKPPHPGPLPRKAGGAGAVAGPKGMSNGQPQTVNFCVRRRAARIVREIYLGESSTGFGERGTAGLPRIHADENGKITLITTITLMFFLLLVCYIGNVGISVKQKMELQNAADSAAYSAALWQARGMNAVTVSNHMMGEATAIIVMLESLGGRIQTEFGSNYESQESTLYNQQIELFKSTAPIFPPPLTQIDQRIIDAVAEIVTRDDGKHNAGATIYDAKMTLKYVFLLCLKLKSACTAGEVIGTLIPPLVFVQIACTAMDIFLTTVPVLKVAQEWLFLEGLEAASLLMVPFHRGIESLLVPAIAAYPVTVLGQSPLAPDLPPGGSSAVGRAAETTLRDLGAFYGQQQIELATIPLVTKLTLPIRAEPVPAGQGEQGKGAWEMPPSEWDGPFFTNPMLAVITDGFAAIDSVAGTAADFIEWILGLADWIPGFDIPGVNEAKEELEKLTEALRLPQTPDYRRGYPENPSHHANSNYKLPEFYWQTERHSQWVRATYPYVESYREPMIYWMQTGFSIFDLELSSAATYYTHWTNRYTLAKSWEIRGGKDAAGPLVPRMYILESSTAETKGREPWTTSDTEAEKHFVVYGIACRPAAPAPFGSVLFPKPASDGSIAIAAAMFYNANPRVALALGGENLNTQMNNGWDTLNWLPPVEAHEWGDHTPSNTNGANIWQVFRGNLPSNRGAQVQINWQAKLVPIVAQKITPQKLKEGLSAASQLPGNIKDLAEVAITKPSLIHQ